MLSLPATSTPGNCRFYKFADLFVHPLLRFTLVTLEAMAYGVPAATDTSSIREGTAMLDRSAAQRRELGGAMRSVIADDITDPPGGERQNAIPEIHVERCAADTLSLYREFQTNSRTPRTESHAPTGPGRSTG
jgi:glycosyltransferase involved in cell wall biosynthesis